MNLLYYQYMLDDIFRQIGMTALIVPLGVLGLSWGDVPPEYVEMAAQSVQTNVAVILEYQGDHVTHVSYEDMSNYEKAQGETRIAVLNTLAQDEAHKIIATGDTQEFQDELNEDALVGRLVPGL